jgi:hypothetical protein
VSVDRIRGGFDWFVFVFVKRRFFVFYWSIYEALQVLRHLPRRGRTSYVLRIGFFNSLTLKSRSPGECEKLLNKVLVPVFSP